MVRKTYDWPGGAILEDHSRSKHKVLREYFFDYLDIRCRMGPMGHFRLAIIDGFSGAGRYRCGAPGSPIIFLEVLREAIEFISLRRATQGLPPINFQCLLILNDAGREAVEILKENVAPVLVEIREKIRNLDIQVQYMNETFESAYPKIKEAIQIAQLKNVVFNLDPCGHSHVHRNTIIDIMRSYASAEIFYTFQIESLIAFLQKSDPVMLSKQLSYLGLSSSELGTLEGAMSRGEWLGTAERIVFEAFKVCSSFVSPFSIHNPSGWRYWLIHFAQSYRARQAYNNILHKNSSSQAHFGRSGLEMLIQDPRDNIGSLYLFEESDRVKARDQLSEDIPRMISKFGDAMRVQDFFSNIYNETPAHSDDINKSAITSSEIEILTPGGGVRRKHTSIKTDDIIRLKEQKSFFPIFDTEKKTDD